MSDFKWVISKIQTNDGIKLGFSYEHKVPNKSILSDPFKNEDLNKAEEILSSFSKELGIEKFNNSQDVFLGYAD